VGSLITWQTNAQNAHKNLLLPTIGELQRTTSVGPKAIFWHWCNKCRKWQGHSPEEHRDTVIDVEELEDDADDVDEELRLTALDGCHEMDAITDSLDEDRLGSLTEGSQ
jgi:hypothetical protein